MMRVYLLQHLAKSSRQIIDILLLNVKYEFWTHSSRSLEVDSFQLCDTPIFISPVFREKNYET